METIETDEVRCLPVILKHKLLQRLVHNHVGRKNDCKNDTKQRSLSVV